MTNSFLRYAVVFSVFAVLAGGCTRKQGDDDEEGQSSPAAIVAVKTATVMEGDMDIVVTATGSTDAIRKEKVFSPIAGKIVSLNVLEGTPVTAGAVLAIIQTKESHAAIAGAEALLNAAKNPAESAEGERSLKLAESTQSTVSVRSKFDGIVSTRNVSEGELVAENAELCTLLDLSTIIFNADVMLRDLPEIHVGQPASIQFQSLPGRILRARVTAINPQTEMQSQTVKVRMGFSEHTGALEALLKTDMAGTARIVTRTERGVLIIPKNGLLRNDETNTFSIVAMTPDSMAESIPVTIGATTDSTVEIRGDNIRKGMAIITEGNYALADSVKVTVMK